MASSVSSASSVSRTKDRVGLADVGEHLVGVHQIVHGDEVEAHAELVPEQPFGERGEQHRVQAQAEQQLQREPMPAAVPDARRARQQVERQR